MLAVHLVLQELDRLVQRAWRVPGWVRYVDDLVLFHDDRAALEAVRDQVGTWLWEARGLRLKDPEAPVRRCAEGIAALGHRIDRQGIAPLPRNVRRWEVRLRRALKGRSEVGRGMAGSSGVLMFG